MNISAVVLAVAALVLGQAIKVNRLQVDKILRSKRSRLLSNLERMEIFRDLLIGEDSAFDPHASSSGREDSRAYMID
jgi:hypothetical protein